MVSSIFRIAEQCRVNAPEENMQTLIAAVQDSFGAIAKLSFYENKQDGTTEVDGSLIFTFGKTTPLTPAIELSTDMYYIVVPSSSVALPGGYGIQQVSFLKGQATPFAMTHAGSMSIWSSIKAGVLGGRQTYFVEGTKMYFPKMTSSTNGNVMLKLVVALAAIDVREELNIPPDMISQIIVMVNQKFAPIQNKA